MIRTLEVIWIFDTRISPQDWKMAVCIQPDCGFFFRINTRPWKPAIKIEREPHRLWLKYDSYLECSIPFDLDDYAIEQAIKKDGILGRVHSSLAPLIYAEVQVNETLAADDKAAIALALGCARAR